LETICLGRQRELWLHKDGGGDGAGTGVGAGAFRDAAVIERKPFVRKYPPLSIVSYSFIQLSELEQRGVSELAERSTRQHRIRNRVF